MKAAVLVNTNNPLRVYENIIVPKLLKGQVLVEIAYSGVCHSQLMETRGYRGEDPYLPHLLGHEGTGKVLEVGPEVTKVKAGDWVVLGWIKGKGANVAGACFQHENFGINSGGVTTFSEQTVVSENRLVKLPDGIPLDIGVLFGCAVPTGAGIVLNVLKPKPNSSLVIFGLGGIGICALAALASFKCKTIIAVDVSQKKLDLARDLGANVTINASNLSPVSSIQDLTDGKGTDYAIDAAGLTTTIEQAFSCIKSDGGICVFASHPKKGMKISIDPFELILGKQILGSWGGDSKPDRDIPVYADLYLKGLLHIDKLLSKTYSLDQINEAIDDLEQGVANRPLILVNQKLVDEYNTLST